MIQNAKDYNDPDSVIYEDAERIRKLVYNFMKQNNPAYKDDPKYAAVATPVPRNPSEPVSNGVVHEADAADDEKSKAATSARNSEQPDRKSSIAPSATTGEVDGAGDGVIDFEGKSFQDAQQLIVSHLLHYTDEEYVSTCQSYLGLSNWLAEASKSTHRSAICRLASLKTTTSSSATRYRSSRCPNAPKASTAVRHPPMSPTSRPGMLSRRKSASYGAMRKSTTKTAVTCTISPTNSR